MTRRRLYSLRELAGVVTIALTIAACGLYWRLYPNDWFIDEIVVQGPQAVLPGVWVLLGTFAAGPRAPYPLPVTAFCLLPMVVALFFFTATLSEWLHLLSLPPGCRLNFPFSHIIAWGGIYYSLPFAGVVLVHGLVVRFVRRDDSPAGGDPVT